VYTMRGSVFFKESPDQDWKPYSETIGEYILPDRHRIRVTMLYRGFEDPRSDVIRIGGKLYIKRPDGEWRVDVLRQGPNINENPDEGTVEYRDLGYEPIGGKKVLKVQKTTQKTSEKDGVKVERNTVELDWIDVENRRVLKEERITDSTVGQPYRYLRTLTIYDYVSKVTIEAPVK